MVGFTIVRFQDENCDFLGITIWNPEEVIISLWTQPKIDMIGNQPSRQPNAELPNRTFAKNYDIKIFIALINT